MPWTDDNPPAVAKNWTPDEIHRCVRAANATLARGKSDQDAVFACIHAAGKSKKQQENTTTSAMVAFAIPLEIGTELLASVDSKFPPDALVPLSQIHLTLVFLGKAEESDISRDTLIGIVTRFASDFGNSLTGKISGLGLFNPNDDGVACLYASFDSPALPDFRQALIEYLKSGDIDTESEHGFSPHITLAYLPSSMRPDLSQIEIPSLEITFDAITVGWGKGDWTSIPMVAPKVLPTRGGSGQTLGLGWADRVL